MNFFKGNVLKILKGMGIFLIAVMLLDTIVVGAFPSKVKVSQSEYLEAEEKLKGLEENYSKLVKENEEDIQSLKEEKNRVKLEFEDINLKQFELDKKISELD